MNTDFKIILTIITTLALMFITSLLLDIPLIKALLIRQIIIYIAITVQFIIGFALVKFNLKQG
jgi:hypothetical protein